MTPAELALSWRSFALDGLAAWRLVVRRGAREVRLTSSEVLALCAAVELERVHAATVDALLARRKRARAPWTLEDLLDGADGLSAESAPGEMSLAEVLRIAGLVFVRSEVRVPDGAQKDEAA